MVKTSLQEFVNLFTFARIKGNRKSTKHAASKHGHKHQHNLSRGEINHLKFIES